LEKTGAIGILDVEIGIILVKQNKLEESIPKLLNTDFPNKIKVIQRILTIYPDYDLIYLIIKFIVKNTLDDKEKESLVLDILETIKDRYDLIYVILY
jgi:hypothetical protein